MRGHQWALPSTRENKTLRYTEKMIERARNWRVERQIICHTRVNGWNKLPSDVVEMGSLREFKRRLNRTRMPVFEESGMKVAGLSRMVERNASINFPL